MNIIEELRKEDSRFDCPEYRGVVFVHPEDIDVISNYLQSNYNLQIQSQRGEFTFISGATLTLGTVEGERPHHNYAGYQITTLLIDLDCFGKYCDGNFKPVGRLSSSEFIMYMISRTRSPSKYYSRMVLC